MSLFYNLPNVILKDMSYSIMANSRFWEKATEPVKLL